MKIKRCVSLMKLARYIQSDDGAVAVVMGMLLPLLVGMGGVGVDVGHWLEQKRTLQTAMDAAARAGAHEIANGRSEDDARDAAEQEATINLGYTIVPEVEFPDNEENGKQQVLVSATSPVDVWLSNMFVSGGVDAYATATAEVSADGRFCFLSLNPSVDNAVVVAGDADIQASGCGIAVNSSSTTALNLNGNPIVNVGEVKIVGDTEDEEGLEPATVVTNTTPTADPYADLGIQPYDECSEAEQDAGPASFDDATLPDPDLTGGVSVYCGGLTLGGNGDTVLPAGTYIIDGGDFQVTGNGTIVADGVTIILTNSGGTDDPPYGIYGSVNVSGGKDMYFKAPTTGDYAGIAFYQDRNTPVSADNNDRNKITGTAGITLDGLFYAPSRPVEFGGNGASTWSVGEVCSKIIANTISFAGTPDLGSDCTDSATSAIGVGIVTLVN